MANPLMTVLLALVAAPGILQGITNSFPPFAAGMARRGYRDRPNLLPAPGELVAMRLKEVISNDEYVDKMRAEGYNERTANELLAGTKNYLSAFDYVTLWRRGNISEPQLDDLLKQQGFDDQGIYQLKQVTLYFPTPSDIVRFGVRDVYTPQTIKEYGLDQDVPPNLFEVGLKAGLPPDTSLQYWMAHWELPSPTQVYAMLHRRIITEEQASTYLKVADYMPYWRDKLVALSYDPLTRVDVRRMFAFGVLSEEEVYDSYRDLGYDDKNAQRLTAFTVAETKHSQDSTPKGVIVESYKSGLIDRATALSQLVEAKVSVDTANSLLDVADSQIKQQLIDLKADSIIDSYIRGGITLDEVRTQLTAIGVTARMMDLTIQRELAQAKKREKVSSHSDLDKWWTMGFLSDNMYTKKMTALGYTTPDINLYLAQLKLELAHGSDKKIPAAVVFRKYVNNEIGKPEVYVELQAAGYKGEALDELMEIVSKFIV